MVRGGKAYRQGKVFKRTILAREKNVTPSLDGHTRGGMAGNAARAT